MFKVREKTSKKILAMKVLHKEDVKVRQPRQHLLLSHTHSTSAVPEDRVRLLFLHSHSSSHSAAGCSVCTLQGVRMYERVACDVRLRAHADKNKQEQIGTDNDALKVGDERLEDDEG